MKVQGLTIRNFKGIKHERLQIKGNNVYVLGRNAMGKTSFLDAIFKILAGKNMPSMPTSQGERSGDIEIDMGEFIVKAKFNSKNEKVSVTVETKEGAQYPSPRAFLDEKIGTIDFSVDDFFKLSTAKQVEKMKQLAGVDFSDIDEAYKTAFDKRTEVNRKVNELEIKLEGWDKNNIVLHDLKLSQKHLNDKRDFNTQYENYKKRLTEIDDRKSAITEEIKQLHEKLYALEKEQDSLSDEHLETNEWCQQNEPYKIEDEDAKLLQLIEENKTIQKNIDNQEVYKELVKLLEEQKTLNSAINRCQETKANELKAAQLPGGLSLSDDGLMYHGLPFEAAQINRAQQIIIGLQINLALLGEVKIARFEGSLIDDENMEFIEDWAHKNGLQLFVEMVDRSAESLRIEVKEVL
jgi:predicted ATP-dependent endonuclease of OLD family